MMSLSFLQRCQGDASFSNVFEPLWRRILAVIVVVAVGVGGVWWYEARVVEGLRQDAAAVEFMGVGWFERGTFNHVFSRYVASSERGVDFLGWRVKEDCVGDVRKAVEAYDAQAGVSERLTYERVVDMVGPGFRQIVVSRTAAQQDPLGNFIGWCNKKPTNLVYADTPSNRAAGRVGAKVNLPVQELPTNFAMVNKSVESSDSEYEFSSEVSR